MADSGPPPGGRVAGFWIRLVADALDAALLGVVGWIIATVFHRPLLALGERAIFVGLPISLFYCGVLQSRIGGGRTPAKRLLGLRVMRMDGGLLSLDRALVRWSLLGLMVYGTAATYAFTTVFPFFDIQTVTYVMGGLRLALIVGCALIVPFHPLKRGLHDLLTGSMVVRGGMPPDEVVVRASNPRRDRRLVIVSAVFAAAAAVAAPTLLPWWFSMFAPGSQVVDTMRAMGVKNAGVAINRTRGASGAPTTTIIAVGYIRTGPDGAPTIPDAKEKIIAAVRAEVPLAGIDAIGVLVSTGINLGIYKDYSYDMKDEAVSPAGATR